MTKDAIGGARCTIEDNLSLIIRQVVYLNLVVVGSGKRSLLEVKRAPKNGRCRWCRDSTSGGTGECRLGVTPGAKDFRMGPKPSNTGVTHRAPQPDQVPCPCLSGTLVLFPRSRISQACNRGPNFPEGNTVRRPERGDATYFLARPSGFCGT